MSHLKKFKLLYIVTAWVLLLGGSVLLTHFPYEGMLQADLAPPSFQAASFSAGTPDDEVREWIEDRPDMPLFVGDGGAYAGAAASASMSTGGKAPLPSHRYMPVFGDGVTAEQFERLYSYVPAEELPGYGRTVYSSTIGSARLLFLNGQRLNGGGAAGAREQLDWVLREAAAGGRGPKLVWIGEEPGAAGGGAGSGPGSGAVAVDFWKAMEQAKINAVFVAAQGRLYVPTDTVVTEPSVMSRATTSGGAAGWSVWEAGRQFAEPHLLIVSGVASKLKVVAENRGGEALDQLVLDATNRLYADAGQERTLVAVQSLWRYHAAGADVKAVIPEGMDLTGEQPIEKRFQLPDDDWRSAKFNDSGWDIGRGPLGYSWVPVHERMLRTKLTPSAKSPAHYFRKTFTVDEDPSTLKELLLHITYEDGYVAYINGTEVARDSIKGGLIDYRSLAYASEGNIYATFNLTGHLDKLVRGTNTIAVEVHRSHPKAHNLMFDLSLTYVK
ncbi:hypothetical protein [Paenibacillus koleovorans]|uniref:hypothetical protein n=1 Tax=Paenibacillus koleovorans TaxID=121608 RepID=UPI000FDC9607|nr:hypothetical protein [Paenibacillus koleovorans]